MQNVPLKAEPNQTLNVQLGGQPCTLQVYEKFYGLYIDVYVANTLIVGGVLGENNNRIVRSSYLGFIGDFIFSDAQGNENPTYEGLGSRFFLLYLNPDDLGMLGLTG